MTELEDIILTIDTREQNQVRIKAVQDWFTEHKAVVEHSALKHCDYRLIGEFRGISVNLGVEAKGWDNFLSDDIAEMEEKLLLATAEYDHVGFFVETQNYSFVPDENNKHGKLNYSIPRLNKNLPAKTLAAFEGFLDTVSKHPQIHVRQLRSEAQFPYSLYDLLVYLQKPHTLTVKPEGYVPSLQNLYMQIPQVGVERAKKLIQHYPNLFWLSSASEESLISVMGMSMGTILYQFLHNTELQTPEWMAGHHLDGTDKYKTICGQDCYNPQHCNTLCERHPDNPKFNKGSKQDDEGRLAFDVLAKNPANVDELFECGITDSKKCSTCPKFDDLNSCGYQIPKKKCSYANPKKKAECKTPDHFKQHSDDSIAIMAAIEGYLSGFPEGRTVNEICEHFNIKSGDPDKQLFLRHIKKLAWEEKITSDGNIFKNSSHAEGTILNHHNPPIPSADTSKSLSSSQAMPFKDTEKGRASKRPDKYEVAVTHDTIPSHPGKDISTSVRHGITPQDPSLLGDTSSHPDSILKSVTPTLKSDDPQRPPINRNQNSVVKQEGFIFPPAEINIGFDDKPLDCIVKCRACYQLIVPEQDDDTGFCHDPDCIKIRKEPSLENKLRIFLREPHSVEEIVEKYGCSTGYTYQVCMANVKSGNIKKVTEQDGRVTFQRINYV